MAKTPGGILKAERERQKKSLREIAQKLKLNSDYLKAIESENYSVLPAEIFTRSYIRMYADSLGLDSDSIVELYDSCGRGESVESEPRDDTAGHDLPHVSPQLRSFISRHSVVLATVIVAVALIVFLAVRDNDKPHVAEPYQGTAVEQAAPEQKADSAAIETAGPAPKGAEESPPVKQPAMQEVQQPAVRKPVVAGSISLKIVADDLTWVSVRIDEGNPAEWFLRPGESIELSAREQFALKVGNAGGTRLFFNGQDVGVLGPRGRIIDLVLPATHSNP